MKMKNDEAIEMWVNKNMDCQVFYSDNEKEMQAKVSEFLYMKQTEDKPEYMAFHVSDFQNSFVAGKIIITVWWAYKPVMFWHARKVWDLIVDHWGALIFNMKWHIKRHLGYFE